MNTVSAFVAMGIFTYFASQVAGLKYTLIFYGFMCLLAAVLLYFVYDEKNSVDDGEEEDKIELKDIGRVLKMPQTWILAFTLFSIYAVYSGSTLLFGTKKLRTLGGDLGAAIKGFKKAMNDDDAAAKKGADVDLQAEKLSHKE